jgi:hypothetical protein
MSDAYTLDGQKISGRGVVSGSFFRVVPLDEAQLRFGSRGGGGGGGEVRLGRTGGACDDSVPSLAGPCGSRNLSKPSGQPAL